MYLRYILNSIFPNPDYNLLFLTFRLEISNTLEFFLQTLRPLEDKFLFSQFQAPPLDDADFSAKPMIMVIGQYSVGEFGICFRL